MIFICPAARAGNDPRNSSDDLFSFVVLVCKGPCLCGLVPFKLFLRIVPEGNNSFFPVHVVYSCTAVGKISLAYAVGVRLAAVVPGEYPVIGIAERDSGPVFSVSVNTDALIAGASALLIVVIVPNLCYMVCNRKSEGGGAACRRRLSDVLVNARAGISKPVVPALHSSLDAVRDGVGLSLFKVSLGVRDPYYSHLGAEVVSVIKNATNASAALVRFLYGLSVVVCTDKRLCAKDTAAVDIIVGIWQSIGKCHYKGLAAVCVCINDPANV